MKTNIIFTTLVIIFLFSYQFTFSQNQFWEQIAFSGRSVNQLVIDRQDNFYASVSDTDGYKKLFKSIDGVSWELIFTPYQGVYQAPLNILIDTTNQGFDKIYILKSNLLGQYQDSLFISIDSGETWNTFPMPPDLNSSYLIKQMAFNSTGDLYIVNHTKVYFTTNGGNTWEVLINGDSVGWSLTRIQIDIQGNIYTSDDTFDPYHGYYEDIYKSTDKGSSWQLDISSYSYGIQFDNFESLPSGEMYAGILFGNFYFKKSPGLPWTNIQASIDPGSIIVNRFYDVYVSKYYSTGNIMPSRCSPDYGTTWFDIDDGTLRFHNLDIDKNGYLYAATSTGLFKSTESTFPIVRNLSLNFPQTAIGDTTTLGVYFSDPFVSQLIVDSLKTSTPNFSTDFIIPLTINPGDSQLVNIFFHPQIW